MVRPRLRRTRTGTTAGTRAATAAIAMAIAAGAMMRIIWPDTGLTITRDLPTCPSEPEVGFSPRVMAEMTDLETLPAETIPETEEVTETGEPEVAHIVKVEPGETAAAKVLEARINGTPLEALCGHVWVPSRDPRQLPVCQACKEVYEMFRIFNDGLRDTPGD